MREYNVVIIECVGGGFVIEVEDAETEEVVKVYEQYFQSHSQVIDFIKNVAEVEFSNNNWTKHNTH